MSIAKTEAIKSHGLNDRALHIRCPVKILNLRLAVNRKADLRIAFHSIYFMFRQRRVKIDLPGGCIIVVIHRNCVRIIVISCHRKHSAFGFLQKFDCFFVWNGLLLSTTHFSEHDVLLLCISFTDKNIIALIVPNGNEFLANFPRKQCLRALHFITCRRKSLQPSTTSS